MARTLLIDIKQLSGYESLADGNHTLKIKSKTQSIGESEFSNVSSFMKITTPPVNYLTFYSNSSFTMDFNNISWDGNVLYSTDRYNWYLMPQSKVIEAEIDRGIYPFTYRIYLCGFSNTYFRGTYQGGIVLTATNDVSCSGNIATLLDYITIDSGGSITSGASSCFLGLFCGCDKLISAPTLSLTTATSSCYEYMFKGSGLIYPPEIPMSSASSYSFHQMFMNCTRLVRTPVINQTTSYHSHQEMFKGCTALTEIQGNALTCPSFFSEQCFASAFEGCTSLTQSPKITTTVRFGSNAFKYCFKNCSNITKVGKITTSSTLTWNSTSVFQGFFYRCYKIKAAIYPDAAYPYEFSILAGGTYIQSEFFYDTGGSWQGQLTTNEIVYLQNEIIT